MLGLAWNGVLGLSGQDRDAEQKQDLDHPANDLLTNRKGAAGFMGALPLAQRPMRAKQSLRSQISSMVTTPKTSLPREKKRQWLLRSSGLVERWLSYVYATRELLISRYPGLNQCFSYLSSRGKYNAPFLKFAGKTACTGTQLNDPLK